MTDLILYSYYRSSASYRVRIALNLKKLSYEYRPVHLLANGGEQNQRSYRELNPSGEVPTLVHNGQALGQSMAIMQYLDRIAPAHPCFRPTRFVAHKPCKLVKSSIAASSR